MAGLLVPGSGGREGSFANDHLKDTPLESSILLVGDSFLRVYQLPEPSSLGRTLAPRPGSAEEEASSQRASRRLLPGSAGFPSLLARELSAPVDYLASDGGAATEVRRRLSIDPGILENKTLVVWEFTERDLALGRDGWQDVPLPQPDMAAFGSE